MTLEQPAHCVKVNYYRSVINPNANETNVIRVFGEIIC